MMLIVNYWKVIKREHLFSKAGKLVRPDCCCLSDNTFDEILFITWTSCLNNKYAVIIVISLHFASKCNCN